MCFSGLDLTPQENEKTLIDVGMKYLMQSTVTTHRNATPPPLNMLCTLMIFIALAVGISAWTPATNPFTPFITALPSKPNPDNPCYDSDDDCLSTAYSASFIPAEWIRSMDCGKDVDCLPEKLSRPGTRGSVSTSTLYHVDR